MNTENNEGRFALHVDGLGKRYRSRRRGDVWALRDCRFDLPRGQVTALVGSNGAGKTTLLSILAGLLEPTEGAFRLGSAPDQDRISFVAQDKPLYRYFSVRDMLAVGRRLNRVWDEDRARSWLDRFEVPLDRPCGRLSGGQQTHVAFALALGAQPSVLLLDEPLSDLDPLARHDVTEQLLGEVADTGLTVLLSTHMVAELGGVADHLVLLSHGRLLLDGEADDLLTGHLYYVGPRSAEPPSRGQIIRASHVSNQSSFLVRLDPTDQPTSVTAPWTTRPVPMEDLVVAYLEADRSRLAVAA